MAREGTGWDRPLLSIHKKRNPLPREEVDFDIESALESWAKMRKQYTSYKAVKMLNYSFLPSQGCTEPGQGFVSSQAIMGSRREGNTMLALRWKRVMSRGGVLTAECPEHSPCSIKGGQGPAVAMPADAPGEPKTPVLATALSPGFSELGLMFLTPPRLKLCLSLLSSNPGAL